MQQKYVENYSNDEFNFKHERDEEYYSMDFHCHDFYEVYISVSGGKNFIINDRIYEIRPKDMFLNNNYEIHKTTTEPGIPYERYVLEFKAEFILQYCTKETNLLYFFQRRPQGFLNQLPLSDEQYDQLIWMFNRYEQFKEGVFAAEIMQKLLFVEMLVYVADIIRQYSPEKEERTEEYESVITPLLEYIGKNLDADLSLDNLAKHINLSKHHMCKLFKKCTGTTINKFIVTKRIAKAKELFANGQNATEVYSTVGFNDYCHFIRTFTKVVGTSPAKYAKLASSNMAGDAKRWEKHNTTVLPEEKQETADV